MIYCYTGVVFHKGSTPPPCASEPAGSDTTAAGGRPRPDAPAMSADNTEATAVEAVRLIIAAADAKSFPPEKGISTKYLFPYDMVERDDEGQAVKKGEATKNEYMRRLKCFETQHGFPAHYSASRRWPRKRIAPWRGQLTAATPRSFTPTDRLADRPKTTSFSSPVSVPPPAPFTREPPPPWAAPLRRC